ncbi:MAG TPA: transglycosylase family protein [Mycobacteriales bacterium]|nr:transglycosylase family protein [Mycobacteriales bacterium]HWA66313.1 transglycosylase family protein [Mycobacteriales bacterium]
MLRIAGIAAVGVSLLAAVPVHAAPSATDAQWARVAHCESGGNWHLDTGNGYYGGLQFSASTWAHYSGRQYAARPDLASRVQQIDVGNRVYAAEGWSPWPTCRPHS